MIVEKVPKYFSAKNKKNYGLLFFYYRLIYHDNFFLSRQKISSVRTFWIFHFWTFFFVHFSKIKKLLHFQNQEFSLHVKRIFFCPFFQESGEFPSLCSVNAMLSYINYP